MKYIVAVSGGVDSMVLLDMMYRTSAGELIVAHFDHGIRPDSASDAVFVAAAAKRYDLPYEMKRENLGPSASEALARERRYAFLHELAQKHNAKIVTAHHLDDIVETVAINLTRGTGWRGLAVLDAAIERPLVDTPKESLLQYAKDNEIMWREDSTNASDAYLRNRIRPVAGKLPLDHKRQLRALHARQRELKRTIDQEVRSIVGGGPKYSRYLFTHMPTKLAVESLRVISGGRLTRPQLARLLHAIKVNAANSTYQAGDGIKAYFTTRHFSL